MMIRVSVRAFATLRGLMAAELELEVPAGTTISALLHIIVSRYPEVEKALFERPGLLSEGVNILRNGRNIHFLQELDTPLDAGDVIAIFPPVGGG